MKKNEQELIIVGSGTSGLTTALLLRSFFKNMKISIIRPKNNPIIGVGEGSTEHWSLFCRIINIDMYHFVEKCDATFKMGVQFNNWGSFNKNHGNTYYHSLIGQLHDQIPYGFPLSLNILMSSDDDPEEHILYYQRKGKLLLDDRPNQLHFNAFKLNAFLSNLCVERKIEFIEDEIEDVQLDENGFISSLKGISGQSYESTLYIDATGLSRFLSKKMNIEFVSLKNDFPLDRAIPFRIPNKKDDFNLFTQAHSMKSGWAWEIPTQQEIGMGYVFSSDFLTEDKARDEIFEFLKLNNYDFDELDLNRVIKFESGHLKNYWHKNLVSIGLSANFFEPMEATNITCGILQTIILSKFIDTYFHMNKHIEFIEKKFNYTIQLLVDNFSDFIKLHYMCSRNDTDFWKFNLNSPVSEKIRSYIEMSKVGGLNTHTIFEGHPENTMFSSLSFTQVLYGLGHVDSDSVLNTLRYRIDRNEMREQNPWRLLKTKELSNELYNHRDVLRYVIQSKKFNKSEN